MSIKKMPNSTVNKLEILLNHLIIEAVRCGLPKSQVANIYDVTNKTLPAIKAAHEREKDDRRE
jgi:hypothetical protein